MFGWLVKQLDEKCHGAGLANRLGNGSLVLGAGAGASLANDAIAIADVAAQASGIFVVRLKLWVEAKETVLFAPKVDFWFAISSG